MTATSLTLQLDEQQAVYVESLVRSGRFATRHDVVQAGLQALRANDAFLETWLRGEVVPVAAAMMADPTQAIPIDDVFTEIEQLHSARVAGGDA